MDIIKPQKKKKSYIVFGSILALVLSIIIFLNLKQEHELNRQKLVIGTVKRGNLDIAIDGYGSLRSNQQTLITALSSATVEEIILRPGAVVQESSVIMLLSNPELDRELEAANIALAQEKANLRRLKLSNQREQLADESTLAELNTSLKVLQLRLHAEEKLVVDGVVSQLSYQTTLLQEKQLLISLKFQQKRIHSLKKVAKESGIIQEEQINQTTAQSQNIAQRIKKLTVRAGMRGVLQRLPVELGQSISIGQELALLGSDKDLIALIQVPQSRSERIKIGQPAEINTRREKVSGIVKRITPEVRDGNIEVEIHFSNEAPESARPEQNVDAKIFTRTLLNTLYVERPINVRSHSDSTLFKLKEGKEHAVSQVIKFGEESGGFIQILNGAVENDELILSDTSKLNGIDSIKILN